jgi:hypothetical protein
MGLCQMITMNIDQRAALVDLKNTVRYLSYLFRNNQLDDDQLLEAYEKILVVRCSSNLIKSYVLDRLEEENIEVSIAEALIRG